MKGAAAASVMRWKIAFSVDGRRRMRSHLEATPGCPSDIRESPGFESRVAPDFYPFARIVHLLDVLTLNFALHPYCRSLGLDAIIELPTRKQLHEVLLAAATKAKLPARVKRNISGGPPAT